MAGINELLHKKHSSKNNTIDLHINGEIITNEKNVANKFNEFFINIGPKLSDQISSKNDFTLLCLIVGGGGGGGWQLNGG